MLGGWTPPGASGRAVPVCVLDPAKRGACPDVVLRVGAVASLQRAVPEVVLAPTATGLAQFRGYTL